MRPISAFLAAAAVAFIVGAASLARSDDWHKAIPQVSLGSSPEFWHN